MSRKAETALWQCLEQIPFVEIADIRHEAGADQTRADLIVRLNLPDGRQTLLAEIKTVGQPRQARAAVNQLLRYCAQDPSSYGIFMAPYISPGAAEICIREGIGFLDLAGNCFLAFDRVYIRQAGVANPFSEKRDLRTLYSPRAMRVLRVLLNDPRKAWKIQPLAEESKVSLGQASNVKRLLEDREWLGRDSEGFRLEKPQDLLVEWSEKYDFRKNRSRGFYSLDGIADIESRLAEACDDLRIPYALTGFSAAARLAPAVRYQRVTAYVSGDIDSASSRLGFKEVASGANVTMLVPFDEGVYYAAREVDGIRIVSPVQAYLDLRRISLGRSEEAAEALIKEVIRPSW